MKLVLDRNNNVFQFFDCSDVTYRFTTEDDVALNTVDFSNALRIDKAVTLQPQERLQLDLLPQACFTFIRLVMILHHCAAKDCTSIRYPYCMSLKKKGELRKELDMLLKNGTIEQCQSSYATPVALVLKKRYPTDCRLHAAKCSHKSLPIPISPYCQLSCMTQRRRTRPQ